MIETSALLLTVIGLVAFSGAATVCGQGGTNEAAIPAVNPRPGETKEYDWMERQQQVKDLCARMGNIDLVFIGDSIFHYWAGNPEARYVRGKESWDRYFGTYDVVNMGFGTDRTQHVLWRLDHGAVDGLSPKVVVLMIGANNILAGGTMKVMYTPEEISAGIRAICGRLREKLPHTRILLVGILPLSDAASTKHWRRFRDPIKQVNGMIAGLAKEDANIRFVDPGDRFVGKDESISRDVLSDFVHPTAKGYEMLGASISPIIKELLGK